MKIVWLILALTLVLVTWGGQGYHGFETCTAWGQPSPYPPPPYNNPYYYPPPYNYYNYYSAPYADPLSQFLYYVAPQLGEEEREQWEHRGREYYERREHGREGFERRGRGHDRD